MTGDSQTGDGQTGDGQTEVARAVAQALAADRERWAMALHDDAVQKFTVAMLRAGLLRRRELEPELAAELEQIQSVLSAGVAALRDVLGDLTAPVLPPDGSQDPSEPGPAG